MVWSFARIHTGPAVVNYYFHTGNLSVCRRKKPAIKCSRSSLIWHNYVKRTEWIFSVWIKAVAGVCWGSQAHSQPAHLIPLMAGPFHSFAYLPESRLLCCHLQNKKEGKCFQIFHVSYPAELQGFFHAEGCLTADYCLNKHDFDVPLRNGVPGLTI